MVKNVKILSAEQLKLLCKAYFKLFEPNISTVGEIKPFIYHSMVFCISCLQFLYTKQ